MNAQKYLIDNNCGDLILNDHQTTLPNQRIYASDAMALYANQKLVDFVSWLNDRDDVDLFIPNSWIGQFNLSQNEKDKGDI